MIVRRFVRIPAFRDKLWNSGHVSQRKRARNFSHSRPRVHDAETRCSRFRSQSRRRVPWSRSSTLLLPGVFVVRANYAVRGTPPTSRNQQQFTAHDPFPSQCFRAFSACLLELRKTHERRSRTSSSSSSRPSLRSCLPSDPASLRFSLSSSSSSSSSSSQVPKSFGLQRATRNYELLTCHSQSYSK